MGFHQGSREAPVRSRPFAGTCLWLGVPNGTSSYAPNVVDEDAPGLATRDGLLLFLMRPETRCYLWPARVQICRHGRRQSIGSSAICRRQ